MSASFSRTVRALALSATLLLGVTAPLLAADDYSIDGSHSFVMFRVNHLGIAESYGQFDEISGKFKVDEGTPSALTFEINAESIDSANDDRDKHLKSPDFFNTKQFPVIKFTSKDVAKHGDHFEVMGDLMMLGVTKPLTVKVRHTGEGKDPWGNYRTGWHSEFTIKRSDFGMKYMLEGLGDDVTVMVSIEGIKQ